MKKRILYPAGILLLAVIAAGVSGCDSISGPVSSNVPIGSQATGISVTGEGKVTVTPDLAVLTLGVEALADTVAQAQSEASAVMHEILTALRNSGVEDKDIQTQYFRIEQRLDWDSFRDTQTIVGYEVTNTVTAKIRVLPQESYTLDYKAGNVIENAVAAGGDLIRINGFYFTVEEPSAYYDEAREKAAADAEAKAEKLAELAGVRLGGPIYIVENISTSSYHGGTMYPPVALESAGGYTPLSPGETEVILYLQVTYSID